MYKPFFISVYPIAVKGFDGSPIITQSSLYFHVHNNIPYNLHKQEIYIV